MKKLEKSKATPPSQAVRPSERKPTTARRKPVALFRAFLIPGTVSADKCCARL
jgi:hypothetical protein